ncbi:MAG: hypothetical protein QOC85_3851, partial [Streptomyces sp.]|nr:hypothetical protein [Streptomyces sp.]
SWCFRPTRPDRGNTVSGYRIEVFSSFIADRSTLHAARSRCGCHRNLQYDAHGPRDAAPVRRLEAPQEVDVATWEPGGLLDAWVFNRRDGEWIGRVRRPDGTITWLRSTELRIHQAPTG